MRNNEQVARIGHPYIMQSALFAASATAGTIFTPDERVFRNTTPYWLQVHAMGIGGKALTAGVSEYRMTRFDNLNEILNIRPEWAIRFGSTEVTNGWVPLAGTTFDPSGDDFAGAQVLFDRPVYLAPNDRIDVKLRFNQDLGATERTFLFARCSPVQRPGAIRIPVLYGWESAFIDPNFPTVNEEVPVGKFYNEFRETIEVERMIGRLGLYGMFYPHRYVTGGILADLELHDGTRITREPTPLGTLFDLSRQSWIMDFDLPARGYIKAAISGAITSEGTNCRVYLGLLGYRTIG